MHLLQSSFFPHEKRGSVSPCMQTHLDLRHYIVVLRLCLWSVTNVCIYTCLQLVPDVPLGFASGCFHKTFINKKTSVLTGEHIFFEGLQKGWWAECAEHTNQ